MLSIKESLGKKNGTPTFGEWDYYFLAGTPTQTSTYKILVRTLIQMAFKTGLTMVLVLDIHIRIYIVFFFCLFFFVFVFPLM